MTDSPVKEIEAAKAILRACGLSSENYINIVSCPTCGRTKIDLIRICEELEEKLTALRINRVVNGPGEAAEADIGIAGAVGEAVLFSHGKIIRRINERNIVDELIGEIKRFENLE